MNEAVQIAEIPQEHVYFRSRPSWWQFGALCAILLWLYFSILRHLVAQWVHDPNFSHGFFVPIFALFVLWERREKLGSLPVQPAWSGLLVLAVGLWVLATGVMGAELFLSRTSLLIVIAGLTALFLGWGQVKAALFPLLFLLLMIPIPRILFNSITSPLQTLAAILAADMLPLLGVPVFREGNILRLPAMALEVAQACSGIRSLMSLLTLSIIYGYLMESRTWIRVALAIAAVPVAVLANSLRIVGTGLIVQYWDPAKAEGFFHLFSGWLVFVVSLAMLFLLHKFFRVLEERRWRI